MNTKQPVTEYSNARRSHTARFIHMTPNLVSFCMLGDAPVVKTRLEAAELKSYLRRSGWKCVRRA